MLVCLSYRRKYILRLFANGLDSKIIDRYLRTTDTCEFSFTPAVFFFCCVCLLIFTESSECWINNFRLNKIFKLNYLEFVPYFFSLFAFISVILDFKLVVYRHRQWIIFVRRIKIRMDLSTHALSPVIHWHFVSLTNGVSNADENEKRKKKHIYPALVSLPPHIGSKKIWSTDKLNDLRFFCLAMPVVFNH